MLPAAQRIIRLAELAPGTQAALVKAEADDRGELRPGVLGLRHGASWDAAQNIC
jgi:hypothetical protein